MENLLADFCSKHVSAISLQAALNASIVASSLFEPLSSVSRCILTIVFTRLHSVLLLKNSSPRGNFEKVFESIFSPEALPALKLHCRFGRFSPLGMQELSGGKKGLAFSGRDCFNHGGIAVNDMPIWAWIVMVFSSGAVSALLLKEFRDWWRSRLSQEEKTMINKMKNKGNSFLHLWTTNRTKEYIEDDRILRILEEKGIVYSNDKREMFYLKKLL